jgi:hypothetical protein
MSTLLTEQSISCKNCNKSCTGNFCYHCGQPVATKRLTVRQVIQDTFFSAVNVNQGFWFTIKEMCLRPGKAIAAYIEGHRIKYYPPHKYVLLIGAVASFFSVRYHVFSGSSAGSALGHEAPTLISEFFRYADMYTTVINIVTIPVFALFSWILFPRSIYNYAENLVLNTYITAQQLLLFIAIVPLLEADVVSQQFLLPAYILLTLVYNLWVYQQFFTLKGWKGAFQGFFVMIAAYIGQFLLNLLCFILAKSVFDF